MADNGSEADLGAKKRPNRLSKRKNSVKQVDNNDQQDARDHEADQEAHATTAKLIDRMKGKRNPNWTLRETRALISHVVTHYDVLFGNHAGSERTESEKDKVWKVVVVAVNS